MQESLDKKFWIELLPQTQDLEMETPKNEKLREIVTWEN